MVPAAKRSAVGYVVDHYEMSERHGCAAVQLPPSSCGYEATPDGNDDLGELLKALAAARACWGKERLHVLGRRLMSPRPGLYVLLDQLDNYHISRRIQRRLSP